MVLSIFQKFLVDTSLNKRRQMQIFWSRCTVLLKETNPNAIVVGWVGGCCSGYVGICEGGEVVCGVGGVFGVCERI